MATDVRADDARAREALLTDFASTLFVDAGAGTGKTTAIVDRIAEMVAKGEVVMAELVAITFTEAAAAELRTRVREAIQKVADDVGRPQVERDRCLRAAGEIGDASIDTIHAFAGDLLRTYPLHAGLPPDFATMDEIEAGLDFEEHFRSWFEGVAVEGALNRDIVRKSLLLGLGPDRMQTLAQAMHDNYDLLSSTTKWDSSPAPEPIEVAHETANAIRDAQLLLAYAPEGHEAIPVIESLSFARERLAEAQTEDEALVALQAVEWIRVPGNQDRWPMVLGENAFRTLKKRIKDIVTDAKDTLAAQRSVLFCALLAALRDFVLTYADERKRLGVATFQDLLAWARDMLRDNAEVRARVQARWKQIFIDEFQDTDPLQAEIAFFLSAQPGLPLPEDWRQIPLVPGKLCLVGDPKQSIYRFRRADIALYQAIREKVAAPLVLSRNFRSVPAVIDFVNRHFSETMKFVRNAQPEYQPLAPDVPGDGPALWRFGGPVDGKAQQVWEEEATHVANCIDSIVAEAWSIRGPDGRTKCRANYGDICVLMPTRTNLRRLERAFEAHDIPYRVESGEIVVATQEVHDLLAALRAVDDSSDEVAIVAALRSPIYGCSDAELVRWVNERGKFDYQWPGSGTEQRVKSALEHMATFHARRNQSTVAALVEQFIDDRMLVAASFGERRPRESWRRYRYVAARARAFASTGRTTLREFVEWMEGLSRSQAREVSGSVVESDESAVRILTVHRAKGLEFPIVILTGLGSPRMFARPTVIADRVEDRLHAHINDSRQREWSSPGYDDASETEKALDKAEEIRLAYVAATRARDHLVLGLHHKAGAKPELPAISFGETLASMGDQVREIVPIAARAPQPQPAVPPMTSEEVVAAEEAWIAARQAALAAAAGTPFISATARAQLAERDEPRTEPDAARFRRGRGGTSLGRAVHAVLQAIDLTSQEGLQTLARAQAAAEGIPQRAGDVARLVRQACESDPVRRAVASGRYWREVPIGAPTDGAVLEGFIDLLFEGTDGYEVIDYKTDDVRPDEFESRMDHYRKQGEAYSELVRTITGKTPIGVSFVFAAANRVVPITPASAPTLDRGGS